MWYYIKVVKNRTTEWKKVLDKLHKDIYNMYVNVLA